MKFLSYIFTAGVLAPLTCSFAQCSWHTAGHATRLYRSGSDESQSKALRLFKVLSESKTRPVHERGYAKLYLGKSALESGDMLRAVKLLAEADKETDAFWGDELLLEHFERHLALADYDRIRRRLARRYMVRRDAMLRGDFDPRRIHVLYSPCRDTGVNGDKNHWRKYRFMYYDTGYDELRLSACFDFCNERIDALTDTDDLLALVENEEASLRFPIAMQAVELLQNSFLQFGSGQCIGHIEGSGEVWRHSGGGKEEWRFFVKVQTVLLPASGTELTVKAFFKGVIQEERILLLDVDDNPFESESVFLDKGALNIKVRYRTSRSNAIVNFFCGPGEESLHSAVVSFHLPEVSIKADDVN